MDTFSEQTVLYQGTVGQDQGGPSLMRLAIDFNFPAIMQSQPLPALEVVFFGGTRSGGVAEEVTSPAISFLYKQF
jgi:hypothetical protein